MSNQIGKAILFIEFTIIFSLIYIAIYIINAKIAKYPYDTTMDYNYNFSQTDAQIIELDLKNGKLKLPILHPITPSILTPSIVKLSILNDSNYTAFLKINISTTFIGKFFQPEAQLIATVQSENTISMQSENKISMQSENKISISEYFENGAQGIRYINISPLLSFYSHQFENKFQQNQAKDGLEVDTLDIQINGTYVKFKDQSVKLIFFKNQCIKSSKILIIAPHPDDAEIAAFGIYGTNTNSYIITVTAGDGGSYQYDELYSNRKKHFFEKGKIRTWNSITVPLLSGISPENILNLGFFDGTLKTMFKVNPTSVKAPYTGISDINIFRKQNISSLVNMIEGESNWDSLVKTFINLLKKIEPDIIVAPYPALDKHNDHKFSSIALFEAIKKVNIKKGDLYLYTNHFVLNEYYPYGKIGDAISLPPSFSLLHDRNSLSSSVVQDTIYFKSIYSHLLSSDRQKEKIIALDAMNDLRPDTTWRFSKGALNKAIANIVRDILGNDMSYYRRAVRNNELFFVIPIKDIYDKSILNRIIG